MNGERVAFKHQISCRGIFYISCVCCLNGRPTVLAIVHIVNFKWLFPTSFPSGIIFRHIHEEHKRLMVSFVVMFKKMP